MVRRDAAFVAEEDLRFGPGEGAAREVAGASAEGDFAPEDLARRREVFRRNYRALLDYVPGPYGGPVTLYAAEAGLGPEGVGFWRPLAPASEVVEVGGDHYTLLLPPQLERLAGEIARRLDAVSADRPEGAA